MQSPRTARLYQTLTEKITRQIASGQFLVGDRLPAERELAVMYDVSRPTMREAIIALEVQGLVEVRVGSGVYVVSDVPMREGVDGEIGAFELTEARILIEGEVAALAATNITDNELVKLDGLLKEMERANQKSAGAGELVDQQFHTCLAGASRNGAMRAAVEHMWAIRNRSPQCILTFEKARDKGYKPDIEEHRRIVQAVRSRDPAAARGAMHEHLARLLETLLHSTEIDALEEVKARAAVERDRYGAFSKLK